MSDEPLVSVLMTCYNREKYIAEAIESVLASTYKNWELIIVDDGSIDRTVDIAKDYAAKDSRIQVHINKTNLGDYPNRNKAASYARGEYILFCDSDDKVFPDGILRIIKVISSYIEFNFGMKWSHSEDLFVLDPKEALRMHFFEKQFLYIGPGGTFMRRSFFNSIGGYPVNYGPANDMYFNLKVASITPILLFPFELGYYRRHDGQEINNRFSYMYNNYNYLKDALNDILFPFTEVELEWLKKKNKRRFTFHLFNYLIRTKNIKKTLELYNRANFTIKDIFQGALYFKKRPSNLKF